MFVLAPTVNCLTSLYDRFITCNSPSLTNASMDPSGERCESMIGEEGLLESLSSGVEPKKS